MRFWAARLPQKIIQSNATICLLISLPVFIFLFALQFRSLLLIDLVLSLFFLFLYSLQHLLGSLRTYLRLFSALILLILFILILVLILVLLVLILILILVLIVLVLILVLLILVLLLILILVLVVVLATAAILLILQHLLGVGQITLCVHVIRIAAQRILESLDSSLPIALFQERIALVEITFSSMAGMVQRIADSRIIPVGFRIVFHPVISIAEIEIGGI